MRALVKFAGLAIVLAAAPARAAEGAVGTWLRDSGSSRVAIAPCGAALCGRVVWLRDKDGPSHVGEQIFFDMKPAGASSWTGRAFNPEDGKTYSGKMTLSGDELVTSGCVLGGLICKSSSWSRSK